VSLLTRGQYCNKRNLKSVHVEWVKIETVIKNEVGGKGEVALMNGRQWGLRRCVNDRIRGV